MKSFHKHFIIFDPTNQVFWFRNYHHGYGYNNKSVFEASFTDDLAHATRMTEKEAQQVLDRFNQEEFVLVGCIKTVDILALQIREMGVTIESLIEEKVGNIMTNEEKMFLGEIVDRLGIEGVLRFMAERWQGDSGNAGTTATTCADLAANMLDYPGMDVQIRLVKDLNKVTK